MDARFIGHFIVYFTAFHRPRKSTKVSPPDNYNYFCSYQVSLMIRTQSKKTHTTDETQPNPTQSTQPHNPNPRGRRGREMATTSTAPRS